jgi:hypothetical protein
MLSKLLAGMKDESGRVKIKGFYDDVTPLSKADKAALAVLPNYDAEFVAPKSAKARAMLFQPRRPPRWICGWSWAMIRHVKQTRSCNTFAIKVSKFSSGSPPSTSEEGFPK